MKRLKVILTLLGIMLILAVVSSVLLDTDLSHENVVDDLDIGDDTGYGSTDADDISLDPIGLIADILLFFVGFKVLAFLELPDVMTAVILPIYILLIATFWYLVLDFIKDITILGSHL